MENKKYDITILGAGLTGLTLAYYLQKAGKRILIVEKSEKVGGVIQTYNEKGFVFEAGPNTGVIGNVDVVELFQNLNGGCELEVANPEAKNRWIWKNNQWMPLPSGHHAITTKLFSFKDKIRVCFEPFRKKGNDPMESIANTVRRRLGKSFLQYAVDPFISGVYAGDPEKLVTKYALPKLYALEQNYGSFIKGGIQLHKKLKDRNELEKKVTKDVFSCKGGLGKLTNALYAEIGIDNIELEADSIKVKKQEDGFEIAFKDKTIVSKKVVTTFGGKGLANVLSFVPEKEMSLITNLEYARVSQVILGFKNWDGIPLKAFGGLVPSVEKRDILGVLFTSSFFENRAPKDGALLSIFMGGRKKAKLVDLSEDELKKLALEEIKSMLQANAQPDMVKVFKYKNAIPQYEASTKERLEAIEKIENENPGLILAGNIRDGIGMGDRIKQATQLAKNILEE